MCSRIKIGLLKIKFDRLVLAQFLITLLSELKG